MYLLICPNAVYNLTWDEVENLMTSYTNEGKALYVRGDRVPLDHGCAIASHWIWGNVVLERLKDRVKAQRESVKAYGGLIAQGV